MEGFRCHLEWSAVRGLAVWLPWRKSNRPLIYAFWQNTPTGWARLFK